MYDDVILVGGVQAQELHPARLHVVDGALHYYETL